MITGEYDFDLTQGSTLTKTFMIDGIDLDDYDSIRMQIRSTPTSSTVIWNSADGGLQKFSDRIVLTLDAETTAGMSFKTAGYDIELVKDQDPEYVDKILRGTITFIKEYTKFISA